MDRAVEQMRPLLLDPKDPNQLHAPQVEPSRDYAQVVIIHEVRAGKLSVGTLGGVLNRYDPRD